MDAAGEFPKAQARTRTLYRLYSLMGALAALDKHLYIIAQPVLCRSILEHAVDVLYIDQQNGEVAERYLAYKKIGDYHFREKIKPNFDREKEKQPLQEIIQKHYPGKELKDIKNWSLKTCSQRFDAVGHKDWISSYKIMCWAVHNDPTFTEVNSKLIGEMRDLVMVETAMVLSEITMNVCQWFPVAGSQMEGKVKNLLAWLAQYLPES